MSSLKSNANDEKQKQIKKKEMDEWIQQRISTSTVK